MADTLEDVVIKEICKTGDKTNILPEDTPSGSNKLSYNDGIPITTSIPERDGGIPPERKDFNKVFNLITKKLMFLQNGGGTFFNQDVANAIGGYPLGAILSYSSGNNYYKIKSLIDNNIYPPTNENTKTPTSPAGTYYWEKINDRVLFPDFIEMFPHSNQAYHGGYIDFHYNQSAEDYTSRIIEKDLGQIDIQSPNGLFVDSVLQPTTRGFTWNMGQLGTVPATWFRLTKDGMVCQGGISMGSNVLYPPQKTTYFPIPMADNYILLVSLYRSSTASSNMNNGVVVVDRDYMGFYARTFLRDTGESLPFTWFAYGRRT